MDEKFLAATKYKDYVDLITQKALDLAKKKTDYGGKLIKYFGKKGGQCNYV